MLNKMKRLLFILLAILVMAPATRAQRVVREFMGDDGIPVVEYSTVTIYEIIGSKKHQKDVENQIKKFNRIRANVIKVYPYAQEASKNLKILNAELARIPTKDLQETYKNSREHFLFGKYEKELKDLTTSQGKILVKLVDRQTGNTTYSLIHDYKSGSSAFFWQSVGKLFGYNLKEDYVPEDEPTIEFIVRSIENGTNTTWFDYQDAMTASTP
jgi:hypothetical protein